MREIPLMGLIAIIGSVFCGPATLAAEHALNADITQAMKNSFEAKRQATMARLDQDETQKLCTQYGGQPPPEVITKKIAQINQATIKPPGDGKYFGDFKRGEAIAQTGTGLQSSDDPSKPAGGNCYACHQLSGTEIAYGTIGPSLRHYGKQRGQALAMLEYTWGKLYNSNAAMPCSNMPRFGHRGILSEQQLKDLMALLFDPQSPVNQ